MTTPPHNIVVGASLAGVRATQALRAGGHQGPLTLIGAVTANRAARITTYRTRLAGHLATHTSP
ncbi:hypothetical protein AB0D87_40030 [Streptomyces sp. NPDC048342]|uniref:hypothetical protein n=1 Tax=unclassified Streptomyces TaxID=2593676 RepID=UPI0034489268